MFPASKASMAFHGIPICFHQAVSRPGRRSLGSKKRPVTWFKWIPFSKKRPVTIPQFFERSGRCSCRVSLREWHGYAWIIGPKQQMSGPYFSEEAHGLPRCHPSKSKQNNRIDTEVACAEKRLRSFCPKLLRTYARILQCNVGPRISNEFLFYVASSHCGGRPAGRRKWQRLDPHPGMQGMTEADWKNTPNITSNQVTETRSPKSSYILRIIHHPYLPTHRNGKNITPRYFRLWLGKFGLEAQDLSFMLEQLHHVLRNKIPKRRKRVCSQKIRFVHCCCSGILQKTSVWSSWNVLFL